MKCDNCPALVWEGYEYPEAHCSVGFEEDSRDFADGSDGCLHRLSTIKKRLAGHDGGLLECMTEKVNGGEPVGCLTAAEVLNIMEQEG